MNLLSKILLILLVLPNSILISQHLVDIEENKSWCRLNCDPSIHTQNTELVYKFIQLDSVKQELKSFKQKKFPLRFVHVGPKPFATENNSRKILDEVVHELNQSFAEVKFHFHIEDIEFLESELTLEDLSNNRYDLYDSFSSENDKSDIITVYILNHKNAFCKVSDTSISCAKTGGFSYILSDRANNVVLSHFDLRDPKIVAHEFGHFFGLYHTFEEQLFGKDAFESEDCYIVGDRICDTPPDPGSVFEVHVNYTRCEMFGFENTDGHEYKPLIENYMSYYKPCYLKKFSFSSEQVMIMQLASQLNIRNKLNRN